MTANKEFDKIWDAAAKNTKKCVIEKVLEIIDQMDRENEECNDDPARSLLQIEYQDFRERVLALEKGEQE